MLHDSHTHPAAGPVSGATSGTFNVPTTGHELDASSAFQFILTVTDSDGLQTSKAVVIRPDTVNLSFDTVPTGLTILIDNLPRTTPITNFNIVKNFQLPISRGFAPVAQWQQLWVFVLVGWPGLRRIR